MCPISSRERNDHAEYFAFEFKRSPSRADNAH